MTFQIDPLHDPRWAAFVEWHPRASVFHSTGWLEALRRTYGYKPVVYTTSSPDTALTNGIVFCEIRSWITGRRLVSLPFTDHCEPLVDDSADQETLFDAIERERTHSAWKYVELRPLSMLEDRRSRWRDAESYCLHILDLSPTLDSLQRSFHKHSVQRRIRRADSGGLTYEEGISNGLLEKFYRLMLLTRRRHQLPPQPPDWFRNLVACMGDHLKIRIVSKEGRPAAGIITLRFKQKIVYKYGGSDPALNSLAGTVFLFWKTILEAKEDGLAEFDLGRSDWHNTGLITFKDHWTVGRRTLQYLRYPDGGYQSTEHGPTIRLVKRVFARMPDMLLTVTGRLLYPHIG